jgi:glycosyltransferase involved in cell wall biosynthesis
MKSPPRTLSIVIPAYNEASRLPGTIETIERFAEQNRWVAEAIIVDDGSRDETALTASIASRRNRLFKLVTYRENGGKGYAIRRGVMDATGELILISDADLSTPLSEVTRLIARSESAAVVIGSRALDESLVRVRQAWYRQRMGKTFNWLMGRITGLPFRDTQCGFKLVAAPAAKRIFREATVDRFAWDVEMLVLACNMGYRVEEVSVEWFNSPDSRVRIVRDSTRMLADTLRVRWRLGKARCRANEGKAESHQHRDR